MNIIEELKLIDNYKPDKFHPYYYALNSIDIKHWYIFGSLTWEDEYRRYDSDRSQRYREYDFTRLIHMFSIRIHSRPKYIAFYRATEFGAAGECHFHFLIADNKLSHLPAESCCNVLECLWKRELKPFDSNWPGIGGAVIKPYDQAKKERGLKYCLKREYDQFGQPRERQDELSKALKRMILMNLPHSDVFLN